MSPPLTHDGAGAGSEFHGETIGKWWFNGI